MFCILVDKPQVSISRQSDDDFVEEGRSSVTLKCQADANPPARIFWRKYADAAVGGVEEQGKQFI